VEFEFHKKMDPYVLGCIIFVVIQIVGAILVPIFAPKGETALAQVMLATSVVCCWSLWSIFFLAQLHPLVVPELEE